MDAIPKLIFDELDVQEEESKRFLKFFAERLPGWHILLLGKDGKIFFLGEEPELIREIRHSLPLHSQFKTEPAQYQLRDGRRVYGIPVEALNADLLFDLANHRAGPDVAKDHTPLIRSYIELFFAKSTLQDEQKFRDIQKNQ